VQHGEPELLGVLLTQARSSEVFPLPAGAEITVTCRAAARSSAASSTPRSISCGAAGAAGATRPAYAPGPGTRITMIRRWPITWLEVSLWAIA
jgi:hypothetical protein